MTAQGGTGGWVGHHRESVCEAGVTSVFDLSVRTRRSARTDPCRAGVSVRAGYLASAERSRFGGHVSVVEGTWRMGSSHTRASANLLPNNSKKQHTTTVMLNI